MELVRRRQFIALLSGVAAIWPIRLRAQPHVATPTIAFLSSRPSDQASNTAVTAFRQGLGQQGFIEGRNVAVHYVWAEGRYDRLPALAADLVKQPLAVIVAAGGEPSALAAKAVTTTTPIVFTSVNDPIGLGLVASFNHPGGNVTGSSLFTSTVTSKQLEFLRTIVPQCQLIAVLTNPKNRNARLQTQAVEEAAEHVGQKLLILKASNETELRNAFATAKEQKSSGLLVASDPYFNGQRNLLADLALRANLPTIFEFRDYVVAGGLASYGAALTDGYLQAGIYAGRILHGDKPSDLPVVQPTRLRLVLNLKTAQALGVTIPDTVQSLADEVIE
jgi:putative ABC transport system substrate-binding protein